MSLPTTPGIVLMANSGTGYGGAYSFDAVQVGSTQGGYAPTSQPILFRQYATPGGFPATFHDGLSLGDVMDTSTWTLKTKYPNVGLMLSWKVDVTTTLSGTYDTGAASGTGAQLKSWAYSCQQYFNSVRYKSDGTINNVNPWPLWCLVWHEGDLDVDKKAMTKSQWMSLQCYLHPLFKKYCAEYNTNNGHAGEATVPFGMITSGEHRANVAINGVSINGLYSYLAFPSNQTVTLTSGVSYLSTMMDFYGFDFYVACQTTKPASGHFDLGYVDGRADWDAWINNLDTTQGDAYPNICITETNLGVGPPGTNNVNLKGDAPAGGGLPLLNSDRNEWMNGTWQHLKTCYFGGKEPSPGTKTWAGYKGVYPSVYEPWWNGLYASTWENVYSYDNAAQPTYGVGWSTVLATLVANGKEAGLTSTTAGKVVNVTIPANVGTTASVVPQKSTTKVYSIKPVTTVTTAASVVVLKIGVTQHSLTVPTSVTTSASVTVTASGHTAHPVIVPASVSITAAVAITIKKRNIGTYNASIWYNDSNTIYDSPPPALIGEYDYTVAYDDVNTQYDSGTHIAQLFNIEVDAFPTTSVSVLEISSHAAHQFNIQVPATVATSVATIEKVFTSAGTYDASITYDSSITQYDVGTTNLFLMSQSTTVLTAIAVIATKQTAAQHLALEVDPPPVLTSVSVILASSHGSIWHVPVNATVLTGVTVGRSVPHKLPSFTHLLRFDVPWQLFIRSDDDGSIVGEVADFSSLAATDLFNDVGFYQLVTRPDIAAVQTMLNDVAHPSLVIQRGGVTFLSGPITMLQRDFGGSSGLNSIAAGAGAINAGAGGGTIPTLTPTGGEVITLSGVSDLTWVARRLVIPNHSHDQNTYESLVTIGPETLSVVLSHCFANVKRKAPYQIVPVSSFGPTVTMNARFTPMLQQMQSLAAQNISSDPSIPNWAMGFGIKDLKTFIYNPKDKGAEFSQRRGTLGAYSLVRQAALFNDLYVAGASTQAPAPSLSSQVRSTTGGSLSASTHDYQVTYVDQYGNETSPSNISSIATTGSTSQVSLFWGAPPVVPGGMTVNVYGRNSTDMDFIANVNSLFGQDPNGWTDFGPDKLPVVEGQHPPTGNSTGGIPTRLTAEVLDQTQIDQWGSIESFVAQGQFTTVDDLTTYGQSQLAQLWQNNTPYGGTIPLEPIMGQFVPIDTMGQRCCVDYGVGDIATIILNDGTTYVQIIRQIDVALTPSAAPQVAATLGIVYPTLKMFDHIRLLRQHVDYLNANSIWSE